MGRLPRFDLDRVFDAEYYLHFYRGFIGEDITEGQVRFLVRELALDRPMDILDLACGIGRHAIRLAELGHRVTGVDRSAAFLRLARAGARKRGVGPSSGRRGFAAFRRLDMRRLAWKARFDRVLLIYTSFGYFSDRQNERILRRMALALLPGGLLCLDTIHREGIVGGFRPRIVTTVGEDTMTDDNVLDLRSGRVVTRRTMLKGGRKMTARFSVRFFGLAELEGYVRRAGLEVVRAFGGYDGSPLSAASRRLVLVARRPVPPA